MVCSGKGGTGKSTVSVLLGACLARLGRKTLLVELDSGLRSVDIIAGVYGRTVYDIEDVLCGRCEGAKAVVPSPLYPGLSVISAPYEGGAVEAAPLGRLLTAMRPYFDFILLDTAAGMGAPFTAASTVADKALLVLTPDPVALRDGKIVADRLRAGGPGHCGRMVLAVTLHNLPEGMVVGLAAALALHGDADAVSGALALSLGIGLQNIPEGAAVSLPLTQSGRTRGQSFAAGAASGLVEPLGAVLAFVLAEWVGAALPWLMSAAAGCMVCVTAQEMIPEAVEPDEVAGVISIVLGFALMMALDVAL